MNYLKPVLLLVLLFGAQILFAQKIVTITAEETYNVPSHVSRDEAKRTVLERAKLKALEAEFGTRVSQSTSTVSQSVNGETDFRMLSIGGTHVQGEWIETVGEPKYDMQYDAEQDMFVITVKVTGRAREIKRNKIDLQTKILKNSVTMDSENNIFEDGDRFYMYFRTPVKGYLTIYMEDEQNHMVSCLLPYTKSDEASVKVEANQDYIFFAPKNRYDIADEYELYSSHTVDFETIFVVFSPNPFYKANAGASQEQDNIPLSLSHDDFFKWLIKNENADKDLNVVRKEIMVKRKASNEVR